MVQNHNNKPPEPSIISPQEEYAYGGTAALITLNIKLDKLPQCHNFIDSDNSICHGELLPLQDESRIGNIYIKGWICSNCHEYIIMKSGDIIVQKPKTL